MSENAFAIEWVQMIIGRFKMFHLPTISAHFLVSRKASAIRPASVERS
jgi:hypothetical protein